MIKTATRVYAGGDNLWKWYGHEYVKSQMRGMYSNVNDIAKWTKEITGREFQKLDTFTGKAKTFDEAVDEAAARKVYSKLFDKNIKLGHSDWKGLDKEIQGGKFYVYTESENGVPTLEKFTEF